MLKINLLTVRRDAEKWYLKMRSNPCNPVVDHLAMHLDTTVRRRIHQNIRNKKKQVVRRKLKRNLLMSRRTGIGMTELTSRFQGQPNRDVEVRKKRQVGKDRPCHKFSRCLFCDVEFADANGRTSLSMFAFCGESLLATGECKRAWLAALPTPKKPKSNLGQVTPEDVERATRRKSLNHRHK
jgi:hypothetical protein